MDLTQFTPSSALITVIVVALAPFVGVMVTSFTKIIVVLSLLRNALGLQQVPPNVVLNGMALVLTVYVMLPVGMDMAERARGVSNPTGSTAGLMAVTDAAKEPLRDFLVKHSSARERAFADPARTRVFGYCDPANRSAAHCLRVLGFSGLGLAPYNGGQAAQFRLARARWQDWRALPKRERIRLSLRDS